MKASKNFKVIILLGKSGSGKGTQAELLAQKFHFLNVSTGNLLRSRAKKKDFIGRRIQEILDVGGLMTSIVISLWIHEFERWRKRKVNGVILEGSPRKVYEAHALDDTLDFYGLAKDMRVVHLDISDREALKRLLLRGRSDDKVRPVKERLKWFRKEVKPVIAFYKRQGLLIEVDGERPIKTIHKDIVKKLERFLK
jgi:adenylate kinase